MMDSGGAGPTPDGASIVGGGEMAGRIQAFDWTATPLGPIERWPANLRAVVDLVLGCGFPAVVLWGPRLVQLYNDGYRELIAARHPAALGMPAGECWPESRAIHDSIHAHVLAGRTIRVENQRVAVARGAGVEDAWFTATYSPLRDDAGAVVGVLQTTIETTAQHRAEAERQATERALRSREERLAAIFTRAVVGLCELDATGRFIEVNPELCRIVGRPRHELLERGLVDVSHPDDLQLSFDAARRVLETGESVTIEKRYRRPDGTLVWAQSSLARLEAVGERAPAILAVTVDLTARRQAEEALREADRRKDEFLAMLAHELRNPLAPLTNVMRLVERTEPLTERGRALMATGERQRAQLARLLDDLLEVSRITRGKIELRRAPMRLDDAVREVVGAMQAQAEARGQRVSLRLPEAPVALVADPARVSQILENLVGNAIKYTPEGGTVRIELEARPREVELRVIDDGVGIAADQMSRLFELFSQIDATLDRSQGGLGIGLALVRRLAELHGGSVWAASEGLGHGATFGVRLPRVDPGA